MSRKPAMIWIRMLKRPFSLPTPSPGGEGDGG
jgi:hypothetical protein